MYLIDTDILIRLIKNDQSITELLHQIKKPNLSTSIICVGEVLEGLATDKIRPYLRSIQDIEIFYLNISTIVTFSRIRRDLRKSGQLLDNFDILIAATCLTNNLILITGNQKHFRRISGLKIFTSG